MTFHSQVREDLPIGMDNHEITLGSSIFTLLKPPGKGFYHAQLTNRVIKNYMLTS